MGARCGLPRGQVRAARRDGNGVFTPAHVVPAPRLHPASSDFTSEFTPSGSFTAANTQSDGDLVTCSIDAMTSSDEGSADRRIG